MVKLRDAVSAQCVPTVDQDARDALTNVVLEAAELADVKTTRLVVEVHLGCAHIASLLLLYILPRELYNLRF